DRRRRARQLERLSSMCSPGEKGKGRGLLPAPPLAPVSEPRRLHRLAGRMTSRSEVARIGDGVRAVQLAEGARAEHIDLGAAEACWADGERGQLVTLLVELVEGALLRRVGLLAALLVEVLPLEGGVVLLDVALDDGRDCLPERFRLAVGALEVVLRVRDTPPVVRGAVYT